MLLTTTVQGMRKRKQSVHEKQEKEEEWDYFDQRQDILLTLSFSFLEMDESTRSGPGGYWHEKVYRLYIQHEQQRAKELEEIDRRRDGQ